ncbi:hypothetical protein CERSUDRAFT_123849 [Gelatoporia subvermispora B]|uniref:Uncharacterized protein n=1 Tax=Ceriporiopsis subvermispora (strain B) TaxID=914234 RepID=M2RDA2_CERS8|nr:hypothetical protein CERSUDRAFT_123849 [Gelatoporia subvermispora B]
MGAIRVRKHVVLKSKFYVRRIKDTAQRQRHARVHMFGLTIRRNRRAHKRVPIDNMQSFKLSQAGPKTGYAKPIVVTSQYLPNIIPRRLEKMSYPEPSHAKMAPHAGETADLPPKMLRVEWAKLTVPSVGIYKYISVEPPKKLTKILNVSMSDEGVVVSTTHVFAVHNPAPWPPSPTLRLAHRPRYVRTVHLFPIRPVVWLSNCSKLPNFPPTRKIWCRAIKQDARLPPSSLLQFPTIPLRVPSAESFEALQRFLHTHDLLVLLKMLIPILHPDPELKTIEDVWPRFTDDLATCCNRRELAMFARRLLGLWKNMVALQVCEEFAWDGVLKMWDCLVEAIESRNYEEEVVVPSSDMYVCISAEPFQ